MATLFPCTEQTQGPGTPETWCRLFIRKHAPEKWRCQINVVIKFKLSIPSSGCFIPIPNVALSARNFVHRICSLLSGLSVDLFFNMIESDNWPF